MGIPNIAKAEACATWASKYKYVSVHSGAGGGTTGANEASGGSYARKLTTYTPNGAGQNVGAEQNIKVAAGTYTEAGVWSQSSGGDFGGSAPFTSGSVTVAGTGASIDVVVTLTIN